MEWRKRAHEHGARRPDVPDVVVGWRAWRIGRSAAGDPVLIAPVLGTGWGPAHATVATCSAHPDHRSPEAGCGCGLYGVVAADQVPGLDDAQVLGCVALWGEVVEGTEGWRASHGYPRVLVAGPAVDEQTRSRLEESYRIPVHRSRFRLGVLAVARGGLRLDGPRAGAGWTGFEQRFQKRLTRAGKKAALREWVVPHPFRKDRAATATRSLFRLAVEPVVMAALFASFAHTFRADPAAKMVWFCAFFVLLPVVAGVEDLGGRLRRGAGLLALAQAVLVALVIVQGWRPPFWELAVAPAVLAVLCWCAPHRDRTAAHQRPSSARVPYRPGSTHYYSEPVDPGWRRPYVPKSSPMSFSSGSLSPREQFTCELMFMVPLLFMLVAVNVHV